MRNLRLQVWNHITGLNQNLIKLLPVGQSEWSKAPKEQLTGAWETDGQELQINVFNKALHRYFIKMGKLGWADETIWGAKVQKVSQCAAP